MDRLKKFETNRIRFEVEQKYRDQLNNVRNDLDTMHLDKLKELKVRESEILNRVKAKEQEVQ